MHLHNNCIHKGPAKINLFSLTEWSALIFLVRELIKNSSPVCNQSFKSLSNYRNFDNLSSEISSIIIIIIFMTEYNLYILSQTIIYTSQVGTVM